MLSLVVAGEMTEMAQKKTQTSSKLQPKLASTLASGHSLSLSLSLSPSLSPALTAQSEDGVTRAWPVLWNDGAA